MTIMGANDWINWANILITIKGWFGIDGGKKGEIINKIIALEKCCFVASNINNIIVDIWANEKGKNITILGSLIQKMIVLLRQDLPSDVMSSLDEFLKYEDLNKKLKSLMSGKIIDKTVLELVNRRLSFYQCTVRSQVEKLKRDL